MKDFYIKKGGCYNNALTFTFLAFVFYKSTVKRALSSRPVR